MLPSDEEGREAAKPPFDTWAAIRRLIGMHEDGLIPHPLLSPKQDSPETKPGGITWLKE